MSKDYLTPDLLGSMYLYSGSDRSGSAFCYVVSLTMTVDMSVMERALEDLMPRFPQLALKAVPQEESIVYRGMDSPVRVYPLGERSSFAASGAFGHDCLFAVFADHKTFYFDFHKSLTDEKGVVPFVRAAIFRYLLLSGYDVENDGSVITPESEFHDIEADDAFVRLDDIPASRPVWYMDAKALNIDVPSMDGDFRVTQIHVPLPKVKGEVRGYCPVPSTIISPFFSHALLQEYPEKDVQGEYAVSCIQVNLRQYFPTTTLRPFFVNLPLAYNRRLSEYPVATVLMSQKKLLEAQLRTDALAYNAQRRISVLDRITDLGTLREKVEAAGKTMEEQASRATFSLCNIGSVIMPETMLQYITEFYPVVTPSMFPYSISTINFRGDLIVTVASSLPGDGVCRRLTALMKEYGIPAFISESYSISPLKYKPIL